MPSISSLPKTAAVSVFAKAFDVLREATGGDKLLSHAEYREKVQTLTTPEGRLARAMFVVLDSWEHTYGHTGGRVSTGDIDKMSEKVLRAIESLPADAEGRVSSAALAAKFSFPLQVEQDLFAEMMASVAQRQSTADFGYQVIEGPRAIGP